MHVNQNLKYLLKMAKIIINKIPLKVKIHLKVQIHGTIPCYKNYFLLKQKFFKIK